jgi:hypothetical protein
MIKVDYQETWYEREERESFETPSPNGEKAASEEKKPAAHFPFNVGWVIGKPRF